MRLSLPSRRCRLAGRPGIRPGDLARGMALWAALAPVLVPAAEWSATPHASATLEFNDNRRLTTLPHDAVFGRILRVSTALAVESETVQVRVTPELRVQRFSGEEGLDTEDQRLDVDASRTTEHGQLGVMGSFVRDTALDSELEGTGVILSGIRREERRLGVSGSYVWSERLSAQAALNYTDVTYDDSSNGGFSDFDSSSASVSLVRQLSETDRVSGTLFASEFKSRETFSSTKTLGVQGTYVHAFSETLRGTFTGGLRSSDLEFRRFGMPEESTNTGSVLDIIVTKEWERTALNAGVNRSLVPAGGGEVLDRAEIRLSANRRFWHNFTGTMLGRFFRDESLERDSSTSSRDLYEFALQLNWRVNPQWSVTGRYRYLAQEREGRSESPVSNAFMITLNYNPTRWSISR